MRDELERILTLPHPTSLSHERMDRTARAAQFAPFAALTGYDDAIEETARRTEEKPQLADDMRAILDMRLAQALEEGLAVTLSVFVKDSVKEGGAITSMEGKVENVDMTTGHIILDKGRRVALDDILDIEF